MAQPQQPRARVRICTPESPLAKLVVRPGGLLRDMAIANASRRLETQRQPAQQAIGALIGALEALVFSGPQMQPDQLPGIRRIANQLVALASGYDLQPLAEGGKRLCDLVSNFTAAQTVCCDSIAVHVRALHLLAGDTEPAIARDIVAELDKIMAHFQSRLSRLNSQCSD